MITRTADFCCVGLIRGLKKERVHSLMKKPQAHQAHQPGPCPNETSSQTLTHARSRSAQTARRGPAHARTSPRARVRVPATVPATGDEEDGEGLSLRPLPISLAPWMVTSPSLLLHRPRPRLLFFTNSGGHRRGSGEIGQPSGGDGRRPPSGPGAGGGGRARSCGGR